MDYKQRTYEEKKKNWKEKALHGEFARQTAEIITDESWMGMIKKWIPYETD